MAIVDRMPKMQRNGNISSKSYRDAARTRPPVSGSEVETDSSSGCHFGTEVSSGRDRELNEASLRPSSHSILHSQRDPRTLELDFELPTGVKRSSGGTELSPPERQTATLPAEENHSLRGRLEVKKQKMANFRKNWFSHVSNTVKFSRLDFASDNVAATTAATAAGPVASLVPSTSSARYDLRLSSDVEAVAGGTILGVALSLVYVHSPLLIKSYVRDTHLLPTLTDADVHRLQWILAAAHSLVSSCSEANALTPTPATMRTTALVVPTAPGTGAAISVPGTTRLMSHRYVDHVVNQLLMKLVPHETVRRFLFASRWAASHGDPQKCQGLSREAYGGDSHASYLATLDPTWQRELVAVLADAVYETCICSKVATREKYGMCDTIRETLSRGSDGAARGDVDSVPAEVDQEEVAHIVEKTLFLLDYLQLCMVPLYAWTSCKPLGFAVSSILIGDGAASKSKCDEAAVNFTNRGHESSEAVGVDEFGSPDVRKVDVDVNMSEGDAYVHIQLEETDGVTDSPPESTDVNCYWFLAGQHMYLYSLRTIRAGDALTWTEAWPSHRETYGKDGAGYITSTPWQYIARPSATTMDSSARLCTLESLAAQSAQWVEHVDNLNEEDRWAYAATVTDHLRSTLDEFADTVTTRPKGTPWSAALLYAAYGDRLYEMLGEVALDLCVVVMRTLNPKREREQLPLDIRRNLADLYRQIAREFLRLRIWGLVTGVWWELSFRSRHLLSTVFHLCDVQASLLSSGPNVTMQSIVEQCPMDISILLQMLTLDLNSIDLHGTATTPTTSATTVAPTVAVCDDAHWLRQIRQVCKYILREWATEWTMNEVRLPYGYLDCDPIRPVHWETTQKSNTSTEDGVSDDTEATSRRSNRRNNMAYSHCLQHFINCIVGELAPDDVLEVGPLDVVTLRKRSPDDTDPDSETETRPTTTDFELGGLGGGQIDDCGAPRRLRGMELNCDRERAAKVQMVVTILNGVSTSTVADVNSRPESGCENLTEAAMHIPDTCRPSASPTIICIAPSRMSHVPHVGEEMVDRSAATPVSKIRTYCRSSPSCKPNRTGDVIVTEVGDGERGEVEQQSENHLFAVTWLFEHNVATPGRSVVSCLDVCRVSTYRENAARRRPNRDDFQKLDHTLPTYVPGCPDDTAFKEMLLSVHTKVRMLDTTTSPSRPVPWYITTLSRDPKIDDEHSTALTHYSTDAMDDLIEQRNDKESITSTPSEVGSLYAPESLPLLDSTTVTFLDAEACGFFPYDATPCTDHASVDRDNLLPRLKLAVPRIGWQEPVAIVSSDSKASQHTSAPECGYFLFPTHGHNRDVAELICNYKPEDTSACPADGGRVYTVAYVPRVPGHPIPFACSYFWPHYFTNKSLREALRDTIGVVTGNMNPMPLDFMFCTDEMFEHYVQPHHVHQSPCTWLAGRNSTSVDLLWVMDLSQVIVLLNPRKLHLLWETKKQ